MTTSGVVVIHFEDLDTFFPRSEQCHAYKENQCSTQTFACKISELAWNIWAYKWEHTRGPLQRTYRFENLHNIQNSQTRTHAQKVSINIKVLLFFLFVRMLVPEILARIMQHAKLGLQTEIISVYVFLDLDLKAMIVMKVSNPLQLVSSQ